MRQAMTHGRRALALAFAAAVALALPLPASAAPGAPAVQPSPSAPGAGDGTVDDSLAGIAPSGDEAFSPDIPTASTSLTARDLATETGERVEVLDQRTATSSLYALPDGTFQEARSGAPRWARTSGDGSAASDWQNVDPRLAENGDGSYSPNAHPQEIVVNGGNGEFFRLSDAATGLAVSLGLGEGTVPAPLVDGARATFADIARDTDLIVEIRPSGYEYFLVLKSPAAAAASPDIPLVLTMTGATMSPDAAGGFSLVDDSGALIGSMPPPTAWDAESDLKRGSPVLDDWSPTPEFAPVTRALENTAPADRVSEVRTFLASGADLQTQDIVDVAQTIAPTDAPGTFHVELAVPAAWADDPATEYPLVLDPSGGTGAAFDTWVQAGYASDQSGSTELKIGTYDSGSHIARSFLTFDWTDYQYTTVSAATLWLWEWHSWSCSATGWDAYIANPASTSTRWTSQPWYGYPYGLSYSTTGFSSSCDDNWVSMDITNLAQIWNGYAPGTARSVALAGDSELNNFNWKRFNSNEAGWGVPYLALTYTSTPPLAPTDITVDGKTLTAKKRTEDLSTKRPVFSAKVTDKVGAPGYPRSLHAVFVLYKDGVELGTYDGSTVASEGTSTYTPTLDLEEGANYTLYVASVFNGTTVSAGIDGGGKFTTTSATPPALASDIMINSLHVPGGVVQGDGSVVVVGGEPGSTLAARQLADSTPAFSAVVSDPDGGQVRAVFSLYRRRVHETEWVLVRNDMYGSWVTSGQRSYFRSTASTNEPGLDAALVAGNEYRVEVRSQDKAQSSATALTTGILTVAPPGAAPDIPAGCDTFTGTPGGSSTTC